MSKLVTPHGGKLCNLIVSAEEAVKVKQSALSLKSLTLNERHLCDIELLMDGAFSPLQGFLNKADYENVVENMKLADDTVWPMPITLDVSEYFAKSLEKGEQVALRDEEGTLIAVIEVEDIWQPNLKDEALKIFGTTDKNHPAAAYLLNQSGSYYIGGKLTGVERPKHYDYKDERHTPAQLRAEFEKQGWDKIIAFQTTNPLHRAHKESTQRAAQEVGAKLLIHPVAVLTNPGDADHYTHIRCYKEIMKYYPKGSAMLSLLPLAMRTGSPREAVWHALIRKNYGCTHFIVGHNHAGTVDGSTDKEINKPEEAILLMEKFADEIEIKMVPFKMMAYVEETKDYQLIDQIKPTVKTLDISGTQLNDILTNGSDIPAWFSYPSVVEELRKTHPPKHKQGFTIFFTGLSGSGKSTVANALLVKLMGKGGRNVTLLDGDVVRLNLSKGLGFSKEDRDANILRIGYVASEITKNGGAAICAPIAPYQSVRAANRKLISSVGNYIEVHISTSLEDCEKRDVKGLYAKARVGIIKGFTGIDDPYEIPENPELRIDTADISVEEAVDMIMDYLQTNGYFE